MTDPMLTPEEERIIRQRAEDRVVLEREVPSDVAIMADRAAVADVVDAGRVARVRRDRAIREVVATEHELQRTRVMARVSQVVDFAFYVVYLLLFARLSLILLGANPASGFVQWVNMISNPLFAPFSGIFPNVALGNGHVLSIPVVVAIVAYAIGHAVVNGLLRMVAHHRAAI